MKKVKITVLKTMLLEDLAKEYGVEGLTTCPFLKEGQVFYADYARPEGFCDEAWKAIHNYALVLTSGGKVFGQSRCIACCNDGARPVVFMLECVE